MEQPQDIDLGKGWTVRFQDAMNPVWIEYKRGGLTYGASLGYFEDNGGTSCDEYPAPKSVLDAFDNHEEIIYEWEEDYFKRNPRD